MIATWKMIATTYITHGMAAPVTEHGRRNLLPPITVVSDGASVERGVGFAAVLLDSEGVVAHCWCHVAVADPSSWVAEWLGQALSVVVLHRLHIGLALLLGDNLSAAVNEGLQRPTPSHYVNVLVQFVARLLLTGAHIEGYVPSQHVTGWRNLVVQAQAIAHKLALNGSDGSVRRDGY